MKRLYLLLALLLAFHFPQKTIAQATAWRPFKPGLIYTYNTVGVTATDLHTLRVDSSYATAAGDSVYTFNRLMRRPSPTDASFYRSRNNLFGARLRWRPGTAEYFLEANAETVGTTPMTPAAFTLRLLPRAAVGSTWTASSQPALTATLSSRSFGNGSGLTDTVATITLSNGQTLQLGRQTGLVQGPQWLTLAGASSTWKATYAPQTVLQSFYSPLALFSMQPGDELGYTREPFTISPFPCTSGTILRRILSRQQTTDSLIITYQYQERTQYYAGPNCGTNTGTFTSIVQTGRMAFSLRTGKSRQFTTIGLLTGEYAPYMSGIQYSGAFEMALGIVANSYLPTTCQTNPQLRFHRVYPNNILSGRYLPGVDALGWQQEFAVTSNTNPAQTGLGDLHTYDLTLSYTRRTLAGTSTPYICGSPINFTNLLANRAAQATAIATLHPNPATEQATLTFAVPARAAAILTLTDALGRQVWQAPLAPGQTTATVPLAGQPAGLYLVQLKVIDATPVTWKLTHE